MPVELWGLEYKLSRGHCAESRLMQVFEITVQNCLDLYGFWEPIWWFFGGDKQNGLFSPKFGAQMVLVGNGAEKNGVVLDLQ